MRRSIIAWLTVLHGLAHAAVGLWASAVAPQWIVTPLWGTAMMGYVATGFGLLGLAGARRIWGLLLGLATMASAMLLLAHGRGTALFFGLSLDILIVWLIYRYLQATRDPTGESSGTHDPGASPSLRRVATVCATVFLAYGTVVVQLRPLYLSWGTTPAERAAPLPGDDRVPEAGYLVNHAITIHAPADSVWPWIAQLGQDRGGFYSYAWLEQLLGDRIENADRIHPEWQTHAPGDLVRAVQPEYLHGLLGRDVGWHIAEIIPGRALVLENWGAFVLQPVDARTTRFIIRTRGEGKPSVSAVLLAPVNVLVFEPAHFIMQRGMMRGIRERAERTVSE